MSFWTGSLSKSVKTCDEHEQSTFAIPIFFFLNIPFHDFSVKDYLILYAKKKTNQGQKVVSPVLNRVAKCAIFCLKLGRGLKASAAQLYPDHPIG